MKKLLAIILALTGTITVAQPPAETILERVDKNLASENRIVESEMSIINRRGKKTLTSRTHSVGDKKSFTEYLSPARDQGTKMLKLENQLWIYNPGADRVIQISGHLLRQSVMGSDLSYEDMMDDRKLTDIYKAVVDGEEVIDGRKTWVLLLEAKVNDAAYHRRKIWVDTERYVPLKEELFAKSGQMLKKITFSEVKNIDGRWFPTVMLYKDMLKQGDGTEFRINSIRFDQNIPEHIFSKASLKQ
jgi:outer membrane lipoprotein-sorting protein